MVEEKCKRYNQWSDRLIWPNVQHNPYCCATERSIRFHNANVQVHHWQAGCNAQHWRIWSHVLFNIVRCFCIFVAVLFDVAKVKAPLGRMSKSRWHEYSFEKLSHKSHRKSSFSNACITPFRNRACLKGMVHMNIHYNQHYLNPTEPSPLTENFGRAYTLYFGLVLPAIKSAVWETIGKSKIVLSTGIWRPTVSTVGRKFPNRFRKPKPSNNIPTIPHRISTKAIPAKKHIVPRIRSRLKSVCR